MEFSLISQQFGDWITHIKKNMLDKDTKEIGPHYFWLGFCFVCLDLFLYTYLFTIKLKCIMSVYFKEAVKCKKLEKHEWMNEWIRGVLLASCWVKMVMTLIVSCSMLLCICNRTSWPARMINIPVIIIGIISRVFSGRLRGESTVRSNGDKEMKEHTNPAVNPQAQNKAFHCFPMWLKPSAVESLILSSASFCRVSVCICSPRRGPALNECQLALVQAWAPMWPIDTSLGLDCLVSMQPWSCSLITPALRPWLDRATDRAGTARPLTPPIEQCVHCAYAEICLPCLYLSLLIDTTRC